MMEENENVFPEEDLALSDGEDSAEEQQEQEQEEQPVKAKSAVERPKKAFTVVTYVFALICLLAGLFAPVFNVQGATSVLDKMLFRYLPAMVNGVVYPFTKTTLITDAGWFYTKFYSGAVVSACGLVYTLTCVLALVMLIPVCACKRENGKDYICAVVTEIISVVVSAGFVTIALLYYCTLNNKAIPYNMFIAWVGVAIVMAIQAIKTKGYMGVFKLFSFLVSLIILLAMIDVTVFISALTSPLSKFSELITKSEEVCFIAGESCGFTALYYIAHLKANISVLFGNGAMETAINVIYICLGALVVINVVLESIALGLGKVKKDDGSPCKNLGGSIVNLIRYILAILLAVTLIVLCTVSENSHPGLYLYVLLLLLVIMLVLVIVKMAVANSKEKKYEAEQQAEDDEDEDSDEDEVYLNESDEAETENYSTEQSIEEPAEEVAEAPVEEATEEVAETPVAGVAEEPVVEEPVEEVAEAPVVEEPVEEVAEAPVVEEPVEEVVEAPVVEEPVAEVVEAPVVEEPVEEVAEAPAEEQLQIPMEEQPEETAQPEAPVSSYAQQPYVYNPYTEQPTTDYSTYNPFVAPVEEPAPTPVEEPAPTPEVSAYANTEAVEEAQPETEVCDKFLATLSEDEKNEFNEVFVAKSKGKIGNIPEYKVGEDNSDFFPAVFVYINRIRNICSDELLAKIYNQLYKN
ncbi:MAG: hypothetical protein ACI4MS_07130 [Candidatus Coproplasma sp.]